jgi:hypothetical protein
MTAFQPAQLIAGADVNDRLGANPVERSLAARKRQGAATGHSNVLGQPRPLPSERKQLTAWFCVSSSTPPW